MTSREEQLTQGDIEHMAELLAKVAQGEAVLPAGEAIVCGRYARILEVMAVAMCYDDRLVTDGFALWINHG